jgi:hypothetical protein
MTAATIMFETTLPLKFPGEQFTAEMMMVWQMNALLKYK